MKVLWAQLLKQVLQSKDSCIIRESLRAMNLLKELKMMLVSLKHVHNAIFGVLIVVACLNRKSEIFPNLLKDVDLHGKARVPPFVDLDQILAKLYALLIIRPLLFALWLLFYFLLHFRTQILLLNIFSLHSVIFPVIFIFSISISR